MFFGLVLLLASSFFGGGESCSCSAHHPQAHYCSSDYVLLVKVVNTRDDDDSGDRVFTVEIENPFKANEEARPLLANGQIWSPIHGSMCGAQLETNVKYLITGSVYDGKLHTSACNLHEEWSKLTSRQQKAFDNLYELGCDCKVELCTGTKCESDENTCSWENAYTNGDCQRKYSFCTRGSGQVTDCQWNSNPEYEECSSGTK